MSNAHPSVLNSELTSLNQTIVVSACNGDPELDELQHLLAMRKLTELGCLIFEADGVYQGQSEKSIVVAVRSESDVFAASCCAVAHKQDSMLVVDGEGNGTLVYLQGEDVRRESIGKLVRVDEQPSGDHTSVSGRYFVNEVSE